MLSQPDLSVTGQVLLGALVSVTAVYDLRWRRIPNWAVAAGMLAGLGFRTYVFGPTGVLQSLAGLCLGLILNLPIFLLRGQGAGDVKLSAAVGAIVGAANCVWIFLLTSILGGAFALVLVLVTGRLQRTLFNIGLIFKDLAQLRLPYQSNLELDVKSSKGLRLPHAAMIFIGSSAFILIVRHRFRI